MLPVCEKANPAVSAGFVISRPVTSVVALIVGSFLGGNARLVSGALRIDITIDEFDDCHRRHVTITEASFQDADITTGTISITFCEDIDHL